MRREAVDPDFDQLGTSPQRISFAVNVPTSKSFLMTRLFWVGAML
jgi:hypothetical protein